MKVLIYSPAFFPSIGGLETSVALQARGLTQRGQETVVVTTSAHDGPEPFPFRVVRRPGAVELLRWVRWCDVLYQANVSLKGLWPLLLVRRPWVVSHHSWYCRTGGRIAWQDRLKRFLLRYAGASIAVSRAVAADLGAPSVVIGNAYDDAVFHRLPEVPRERELIFLGRLVSDKGADLLLRALARLKAGGLTPRLTVVGEGPEGPALHRLAGELGLASQVRFRGTLLGEELVRELNRHEIMVAPSRYNEPFGLVALEAIACGCVVVGSEGGGLPEAIGPCGRTFANGDDAALASTLAGLLAHPEERAALRAGAAAHLAAHSPQRVIDRYLATLHGAAGR